MYCDRLANNAVLVVELLFEDVTVVHTGFVHCLLVNLLVFRVVGHIVSYPVNIECVLLNNTVSSIIRCKVQIVNQGTDAIVPLSLV